MENTKLFGTLTDGQKVFSHTLKNAHGMELTVIDYGATITSLKVPVKDDYVDVVLGFDNIEDYIKSHALPAPPYFGAIIGRYSGRIKNGEFNIGDSIFKLNKNNNSNTLHGGNNGFDRILWTMIQSTKNAVTFRYSSPHLEENFPGKLTVDVNYSLTDDNEVAITYEAVSTADTIINLTNHSYFNLDGDHADLGSHHLQINSDTLLEIDIQNIPTGKIIKAADKGADFSTGHKSPFFGIDDTFIIGDNTVPSAVLTSESSGLTLSVTSDQPALHIYVGGNCFGQVPGKNGANYHQLSGICFESQNYPDAPNHAHFPNSILRKGDLYLQTTIWKFGLNS